MSDTATPEIRTIPIAAITVLNPRSRNKRIFNELVTSIAQLGLKLYERVADDERRHHSEFRYGKFERSFPLPASADDRHIQAIYSHGILEITVGLRPEHLKVADGGPIQGILKHSEQLGNETFAYVSAGAFGDITARMDGTLGLEPGCTINLGFAPEHLYKFNAEGKRFDWITPPQFLTVSRMGRDTSRGEDDDDEDFIDSIEKYG